MTATEVLREEVRQYIDHADDKSLRRVKAAIVEIEEEEDEDMEDEDWGDLPKELQVLLDRAIKEGEEGKVISHEEMKKKYPQWFRK